MSSVDVRTQFLAFERKMNNHSLVYLDSAATTLKPRSVVDTVTQFYSFEAANVHRGAHGLGDQATEKFEAVRDRVARFLNARNSGEIVFTKGTTEAINLVAQSWGRRVLKPGDVVILTEMEHHANIVPWQILAGELGFAIRWIPVTAEGELDYSAFEKILDTNVKLVSLTYVSNSLGTVNPIEKFIALAKSAGARTLIDAAQAMTTLPIDVQQLGCDFLVFSAHKMYGPFGVGVLYGREELLAAMPPYQGGGAMIAEVTKERTTFLAPPQRFEAGTPNISGVIGFGAALQFVESLNVNSIRDHESELTNRLLQKMSDVPDIEIMGASPSRINIVSFNVKNQHAGDVGQLLNQQGVAVRTGHHCTQPLMKRFGVTGTVRASFGVYNTLEDVDIFCAALKKAQELLS